MKISLRQLSLFVSVAQYENITQGAKAIYLSQSAASMTLAELEKQLKRPLFDRVGKKLKLNENGRSLLPKAIEILQRIKELEKQTQLKTEQLQGEIKIGASTTIANYLMPAILKEFTEQFPHVRIKLESGNTKTIVEHIKNFHLDIGLIEGSCYKKEIQVKPWTKDEMAVFCGVTHPLAQKKQISMSDLKNTQWILREQGSGTREIIETHFNSLFTTENIFLELSSSEAIKNMVSMGLGISCLSVAALKDALNAGTLVTLPLKNISITRDFFCITHKEKYHSAIVKAFENSLQIT